jgi:pimeloyl-ACP methyl ester carboxylesterase
MRRWSAHGRTLVAKAEELSSSVGAPVVLLHGYWHGSWCWSKVAVELAARGRYSVAVDMAGHGLHAQRPAAARVDPFDPRLFATESSALAGTSLADAANLLVSQVQKVGGGRPCVLVAHSMGGPVATRAAQEAPELFAHLVYLAAYMPASGVPVVTYGQAPEQSGELISSALRADPGVVGGLRIHPGSADPDYHDLLRRAFYHDVEPELADAAIAMLSCDAPLDFVVDSTELTASGWGSVPRTYVVCERDHAILPPLQRRFIAEADAAFPDNPTHVAGLESAHSPFLSMPDRVADIVAGLSVTRPVAAGSST